MSQIPAAESAKPEHTGPEAPAAGPRSDLPAAHKRSTQKKVLGPLVMAALGLVLLALAVILYPSEPAGLPSPPYAGVQIKTSFPIGYVYFNVLQISQAVAEIKMTVTLPLDMPEPPARAPAAALLVETPTGTAFRDCPAPSCRPIPDTPRQFLWIAPLTFDYVWNSTGEANVDFFVEAHSFGVSANGVAASAAIPEVIYTGPGNPTLLVDYQIPSAASYNWSSFQPYEIWNGTARWQVDLASGDTPARTAFGTNYSGQASDNLKTFLAGALIGLAGAAILSAIQEALHAHSPDAGSAS
jgi:hypothetical protein